MLVASNTVQQKQNYFDAKKKRNNENKFTVNCICYQTVRGITNIKIYKRTSLADIQCSEHNLFILSWINSLVFSYSLHNFSITFRYMLILVFALIGKATPVDRSHFKYLLVQRVCKNMGVETIK